MTTSPARSHNTGLFMLKAFPMPDWIPEIYTTVLHRPTGRHALVVSTARDPETFDITTHPVEQQARPCICTIMLGEVEQDVDVFLLEPVT